MFATILVPTFNESGNVEPLVRRIAGACRNIDAEVLFVDDSKDRTPEIIREVAERAEIPVRLIHRTGEDRVGGLAGAVTRGIVESPDSQFVLVMDGDLQHPPELIPTMLYTATGEETGDGKTYDMVVASRYIGGGDSSGLSNGFRHAVSSGSTLLARTLFPLRVGRKCTDPMTGFFCVRRSAIEIDKLRPRGFKILLEILARHRLKVAEVPFTFGERESGESKASMMQGVSFIVQLLELRMGMVARFGAIGVLGLLVNLAVMSLVMHAGVNYLIASLIGTQVSIAGNFLLQERFVFDSEHAQHSFRSRAAQAFLYNNIDTLARIPILALTVERWGWNAVLLQAITVAAAFVVRYAVMKKFVYRNADDLRSTLVSGQDRKRHEEYVHDQEELLAGIQGRPMRTVYAILGLIAVGLIAQGVFLEVMAPVMTVMIFVAIGSTILSSLEYNWRNYTNDTVEKKEASKFPPLRPITSVDELTSFTLIVPAYHEEAVIAETLERLAQQDYPQHLFEILVTLRDDDVQTIAAAQKVASQHPGLIHVHAGKFGGLDNKSTQMNAVLPHATGDYVCPIDAEDIVATRLLLNIDTMIHHHQADVVQGAVQLTNLDNQASGSWLSQIWDFLKDGWYCVHNVLEYRFWFSSRMFYQQNLGFVPLGGNTVFIRTALMREIGGWNDKCLTEDADLGVKLSVQYDAKIVAGHDPALATREHTPPHMFGRGGLFRQRVRWDQGFWQVMKSSPWNRLDTISQRLMAFYILGMPILQGLNVIILPLALLSIVFLKLPTMVAIMLFVPLVPMVLTLSLQVIELFAFGRDYGVRVRPRHVVSLVFGFLPYQQLLGAAAIYAIIREFRGDRSWSKTSRSTESHLMNIAPSQQNEAMPAVALAVERDVVLTSERSFVERSA